MPQESQPAPRVAALPAVDTQQTPDRRQLVTLGTVVLAYAGLSYYSSVHAEARALETALSFGPVAVIGIVLLWRWSRPWIAVAAAVALIALGYLQWPAIERNVEWADLVQQCAAYVLVAISFGRSLLGSRVPLCTQLSVKIHGELTAAEVSYTRRATVAWGMFYLLMAVSIAALFFYAPLKIWSLFVNFGTFALILLAGVLDHAIRRQVLPRHPPGKLLAILQRSLLG